MRHHSTLMCPTDVPLPFMQYGLVHISVGDLLRDEVKNGTPAGKP